MKPILLLSDEPEIVRLMLQAGYVWRLFWSAAMLRVSWPGAGYS